MSKTVRISLKTVAIPEAEADLLTRYSEARGQLKYAVLRDALREYLLECPECGLVVRAGHTCPCKAGDRL